MTRSARGPLWPLSRRADARARPAHDRDARRARRAADGERGPRGRRRRCSQGARPGDGVCCRVRAAATTAATDSWWRAICTRSACPCASSLLAERALAATPRRSCARARAPASPISRASAGARPAAGVIVDALFGTGLDRARRGRCARERAADQRGARRAARSGARDRGRSAVGLSPTPGRCTASAVRADATVTLGLRSSGSRSSPAARSRGAIAVARIGIADAAPGVRLDAALWTRAGAARAAARAARATVTRARSATRSSSRAREGKTGAAALARRRRGARAARASSRSRVPAGLQRHPRGEVHRGDDRAAARHRVRVSSPRPRKRASLALARDARCGRARSGDRPRARDAPGSCARSRSASICRSRSMQTALIAFAGELELLRRPARRDRAHAASGRGRPRCSACAPRADQRRPRRARRASSRRAAARWWC